MNKTYILYYCCLINIYILNLNDADVRIIFRSLLFYSCRTHGLQLKKNIRTVSVHMNKIHQKLYLLPGSCCYQVPFYVLFDSKRARRLKASVPAQTEQSEETQ